MTKRGSEERLERVNLMLAQGESEWLDSLGRQILEKTGVKVSRSEMVRAGIRTIRELHRLAPLDGYSSGELLAAAGVMAVRTGVMVGG
jgi:hypothetical protein